MNNKSILISIQESVNQIKWDTPKQKEKAIMICTSIFNLYTINGHAFNDYLSLSSKYFVAIIPSKRDYIIKQILVDNGILECDNKYSITKHVGKGYRFSKNCLRSSISSTTMTFTFSSNNTGKSTISYLFPHFGDKVYKQVDGLTQYSNSTAINGATISYLFPHFQIDHPQGYSGIDVPVINQFTNSIIIKEATISYLFPHLQTGHPQGYIDVPIINQLTNSTIINGATISYLCPHFQIDYPRTYSGIDVPVINQLINSTTINGVTISYLCPHFQIDHPQGYSGIDVPVINQLINSTIINGATISYLFPHFDIQYLQAFYIDLLGQLTFDDDIDILINELSRVHFNDLILNEKIDDEYIYITYKKKYRYKKETAIKLAKDTGNDLIKYKDKFYIDNPTLFIENKSRQLNITYCQSVFNIKHKLFYCDRNDTNNRLDYNLTGLKRELFIKLNFDNEKLAELDIANAQFAIAAFLNATIDANFIDNAACGTLYDYIERELQLPQKQGIGKGLMFRVAFDKVKYENEYNQIRSLFPKYMEWADSYKKEHGYKSFSNLLQRKEAEIMIDGLLNLLVLKCYEVFTIHDALRVKQSQVNEIKLLMKEYFDNIGFKCLVRMK